jgi:alpha-amylase
MTVELKRSWDNAVIYMLLIDRFHRAGDGPPPEAPFLGGNLAGVRAKLDYLCDLGVNALWLSPVYKNQKDGYHGYWPVDFSAVDERFGSMAELRDLIDDCHSRGVRVLLDMVLNHTGYDCPMVRDPEYRTWFHHGGDIRWIDQKSLERGSLHGLPDFAQEKPAVARWLIDNCLWWYEQTRCDGFRLDAVKHIPATFWKQFSSEIHAATGKDFLLLGEVYRGVPDYIARYQREDGIDSVFDVPFADTVRSAFIRSCEAPAPSLWARLRYLKQNYRTMLFNEIVRKLTARKSSDMSWFAQLARSDGAYLHPRKLATIIDNHDLSRFAAETDRPAERLRLALTLLMTWRGIPVITYGTEIGMAGKTSDNSNRAMMRFGADPELTAFLARLIRLRLESPALTQGVQLEVHVDRAVYAYLREYKGTRVLTVLNNSRREQKRTLNLPAWLGWNGNWCDMLGEETVTAQAGKLTVTLPPRGARVLGFSVV